MFSKKLLLCLFTIASSSYGCAATSSTAKVSVYAPAEIASTFLPDLKGVNPTTTKVLTLEEILVFADENSPTLKKARALIGLSDAEGIGADIFFPENPELNFAIGGRFENENAGLDFQVGIEQAIEIGGQKGLRVEAAEAKKNQSLSNLNTLRWELHSRVHRVFVDLLLVRERKEQAQKFVGFSESLRDTITKQIDAGESSPLELLVADADLAQTKEAIIEAQRLEGALLTQMKILIGWPSELPTIKGELPEINPSPDLASLFSLMRKHHPALRTRELAVVTKLKELDVENRKGWIDPRIGVAYSRESAPGSTGGDSSNVVLFTLAFPLAIWRTNQEGKARALTEVEIAGQEREITIQRLRGDLRLAKLNVDAALKGIQLYQSGIVPQLEKNLTFLKKAYELGEVSVHQVSQTQQRLLDATARFTNAKIRYYESAIQLSALVGTEVFHPNNKKQQRDNNE